MTLYMDRLPDTKSEKGRGFQFRRFEYPTDSLVGVLRIESPGKRVEFAVDEFPTGWDGRGFHLAKLDGAIGKHDEECQSYDVFVGRNGQDCRCDCRGFVFGKGKKCRHLEAVMSCIGQGWL